MNLVGLLRFKSLRHWYVKARYLLLKNRMTVYDKCSDGVGTYTIQHNLGAFDSDAVFGCGDRMGLLIHAAVSYYAHVFVSRSAARALIVGCRTEDDIYWIRSHGFTNTIGLDLLSYSKHVLLGDIHRTTFDDNTFDIVLLGWMISYSQRPEAVVAECQRILKPGGLLGIGIDHNPSQDTAGISLPRVNALNCARDIKDLLNGVTRHQVVFEYDHYNPQDDSVAVVSRILK